MNIHPDDSSVQYQTAPFAPQAVPPRRGSRTGWLFAGIAAGGALLILLVFGGVAAVAYVGLSVFSEEVENLLRDNPVLVEHLGQVEGFELDLMASAAVEGQNVFVFNVEGARSSGVVTAESITTDDGSERITWAKLRLPDGDTVDLVSEEP